MKKGQTRKGADASFGETRSRMTEIAVLLALGEAETALWRLLTEQRNTPKRVNALFQFKVMREQTVAADGG